MCSIGFPVLIYIEDGPRTNSFAFFPQQQGKYDPPRPIAIGAHFTI